MFRNGFLPPPGLCVVSALLCQDLTEWLPEVCREADAQEVSDDEDVGDDPVTLMAKVLDERRRKKVRFLGVHVASCMQVVCYVR